MHCLILIIPHSKNMNWQLKEPTDSIYFCAMLQKYKTLSTKHWLKERVSGVSKVYIDELPKSAEQLLHLNIFFKECLTRTRFAIQTNR